ncbi:nuclear body protein SP140-like protein isoform X10 [Mustela nigripes]|uniref:nuclear body protein SP140-like protein isoform X10 n=1 Tax=Mustela nigripes TaxID=77151 RepID=UPI0028158B63|nr:nuclear body protein SP140-like protein isoform X10 [Mustela nigripes]
MLIETTEPKPGGSVLDRPAHHAPLCCCTDRMFTENQNLEDQIPEEQAFYEFIFTFFKENKVEIASAINKPFPLLMGLRDRGFISEQKYENYEEACSNRVPVQNVVYRVLCELEKTFDKTVLDALFSNTNLKAYPDLLEICRSFQNVIYDNFYHEAINEEETKEMFHLQVPHQLESCEHSLPQMNNVRALEETSSLLPNEGRAPQMISEGEPVEVPRQVLCDGEAEGNSACLEMCDEEEPQEDLNSLPESESDTVDLENTSSSGRLKRKRRKKKGHAWTRIKRRYQGRVNQKERSDTADQLVSSERKVKKRLQRSAEIRGKRRGRIHSERAPQKRFQSRGSRRRRDDSVDFHSQILPVTCGKVKGMLYKKRLKQGVLEKCIQSEDGRWFTPKEFEAKGGHEKSKNWRMSVRCGGRPLRWLMEKELLHNPPRKYFRRRKKIPRTHDNILVDPQLGNSNICEMCRRGGKLFCCDTCSRSFHEYCHIPPVEIERSPWSCTICRMESFGRQPCHRESEALERQMQPEEQLKCEFLLLKIYCHSESSFFSKIPYYYYIREISQNLKEPMWLDKIKKKLNEQGYRQVGDFVQDMRLIFQNHRVSYKYNDFGLMGLRLEKKFERKFKEVFAIEETNESSSQA